MKLIDLLVQELPKLGGWPSTADLATVYEDMGYVWFFKHGYVSQSYPAVGTKGLKEFGARVTRDQYESALTASTAFADKELELLIQQGRRHQELLAAIKLAELVPDEMPRYLIDELEWRSEKKDGLECYHMENGQRWWDKFRAAILRKIEEAKG